MSCTKLFATCHFTAVWRVSWSASTWSTTHVAGVLWYTLWHIDYKIRNSSLITDKLGFYRSSTIRAVVNFNTKNVRVTARNGEFQPRLCGRATIQEWESLGRSKLYGFELWPVIWHLYLAIRGVCPASICCNWRNHRLFVNDISSADNMWISKRTISAIAWELHCAINKASTVRITVTRLLTFLNRAVWAYFTCTRCI
jgi:hypothetical protein